MSANDPVPLPAVFYALFGAALGYFGSQLLWEYFYGIGASVVSDEVYLDLRLVVPAWGAAAGACSGCAVRIVFQHRPAVMFAVLHGVSLFAGCVGALFGWQAGLASYFAPHALATLSAVVCVLVRLGKRAFSSPISEDE